MREHEALSTLLTAGRRRPAWRALKAIPPVEVAASRPGSLVLPQVLLVVLGEQRVQERVDAAVGIRQARGQVVDVAFGLDGQGQRGVELTEQLPDPEGQEAGPEEEHDGEDQVQHLQGHEITEMNHELTALLPQIVSLVNQTHL